MDARVAVLSGAEAAELVAAFSAISKLASAGVTLAAGRVAATGFYREAGSTTARQWLAAATGVSAGEAGQTIATADALREPALAPTRAAVVDGALTARQAAEVAGAAVRSPDAQERLLGVAATSTAKRLRDECRKVRLAGRPPNKPDPREFRFRTRDLGDGLSELAATMPTSWMVLVLAAVRHQCEAIFARARAEGREDPHQAYMVEALVTLLLLGDLTGTGYGGGGGGVAGGDGGDGGAAGGAGGAGGPFEGEMGEDGGEERGGPFESGAGVAGETGEGNDLTEDVDDPGAGGAGGGFDDPLYAELLASIRGGAGPLAGGRRPRRHRRGRCSCGGRVAPRAKILVRVDQAALFRGWTEGEETCDIAGVGPVPVATVRELWPDAVVKAVVTRGVDVVNVTSLGRRANDAIESALEWQVHGCTNAACDNDGFLQIDHRLGWANTHRTRLDELDPLCTECHRRKTIDNWQLVAGAGRRRFVPPSDPDHPGDPPTRVRRRD